MKIFLIVLGVVVALSSLWGGAYVMRIVGTDHWAQFPAFVTAIFGVFAGYMIAASSFFLKE